MCPVSITKQADKEVKKNRTEESCMNKMVKTQKSKILKRTE